MPELTVEWRRRKKRLGLGGFEQEEDSIPPVMNRELQCCNEESKHSTKNLFLRANKRYSSEPSFQQQVHSEEYVHHASMKYSLISLVYFI